MITHSIKWRLQLWYGGLLAVLVVGLMVGFYTFEARMRFQAIDSELIEAVTPLVPQFAPPGDRGRRPPPREREGLPPPEGRFPEAGPPQDRGPEGRPFVSDKLYYVAWAKEGHRLAASTNAPPDLALPRFAESPSGNLLRTRDPQRELVHFLPNGRCVVVGTSLAPTLAHLQKLAVALGLIGGTILIVGFAVGWWLATRALRPIAEISQAAQEIAAGDLSKRINPSEAESELGKLAAVLNSTFARLETAFAQQQQFTSDAAHELRTPVSVILTQVQSTLNKERSPAEYRETLEACQRAAERMKRLIESLLELARFDAGQEILRRSSVDLVAVARESVDWVTPLAEEKQVTIIAELPPTSCVGDAQRLGQVLANLLTNAVTYNQPGGEVRLKLATQNRHVLFTVADTGPGISAEAAPHVFKRFYRADKARGPANGNAGLGLAICKSIITAHGGAIDFTTRPGQGTEFAVQLPTG